MVGLIRYIYLIFKYSYVISLEVCVWRVVHSQWMEDNRRSEQTSSTYHYLQRDWNTVEQHASLGHANQSIRATPSGNGYSMLQRWQEETMREQPYHTIEAVKRKGNDETSYASGSATAQHQE